ncbi:two-component response regulator (CheY-like receiver domain and a winged-helix DNA-binding domain) [Desulforapulum autotrophicum HRM2]|uniref:Two-component response regulator (CheY-like receiver domain and a winged-helix DNA-binding domain) n=1 Tax=Desulforapulum autotrophicum (strain ATCC 43914 / DSM 3382 / VKM B-1955 / HRM2) TaxID=177437 RepID=C0QAU9_DESAH|nr:response regulator [Desulforapulum autotrophicum]ACN16882.1 two-component response regulator (CheY-like receiver domain and a winged-helix DNA-binding domain) [Desulforapulum autotrophicum HRM2]
MLNTRLMIVDDEERFLKTTKGLMEKRKCIVSTALSGIEALEILAKQEMDVVILDVKMPGMDGVEVLRRIKQTHPLVEVIMLTGHSTTESAVEGMKLGAFDYLLKPCDINILFSKVMEAVDKKQTREQQMNQGGKDR